MNDFLKNIVKEVGNEYATLAADGVEAGDVNSYIDTVPISLMLYCLVLYTVDFHLTR